MRVTRCACTCAHARTRACTHALADARAHRQRHKVRACARTHERMCTRVLASILRRSYCASHISSAATQLQQHVLFVAGPVAHLVPRCAALCGERVLTMGSSADEPNGSRQRGRRAARTTRIDPIPSLCPQNVSCGWSLNAHDTHHGTSRTAAAVACSSNAQRQRYCSARPVPVQMWQQG